MAPHGISCRLSVAPTAVRVWGTINGRSFWIVVDTGSERTFVREDLVNARAVPEAEQLLCGVTGECVTMRGPVEMNIGVGGVMERMPVFLAALEDPCLLGIDFLTRVGACVAFPERKLRVRDREVPLMLGGDAPVEGSDQQKHMA